MIRIFRSYILGGDTDTREGAWFIWLCVTALTVLAVVMEGRGVELSNTWAFVNLAWPASTAGVIGVHVQRRSIEGPTGSRAVEPYADGGGDGYDAGS